MRTFGVFGRHLRPSLDLNDGDKPSFVEINEIKKNNSSVLGAPKINTSRSMSFVPSYESPIEVDYTKSQSLIDGEESHDSASTYSSSVMI